MSTRSFICIVGQNGGFQGIYCHYDGYPEHVGKILVEHHNSFRAAELLVHGAQIRNFDHDGTVVRFGDGTVDDSETYDTIAEALHNGFDYVYLYRVVGSKKDNRWQCFGRDRSTGDMIAEYDIPTERDGQIVYE
jgi:hypothetical protein